MRNYSQISKRVQALILAVAMMLSTLSVGLAFGVTAADDPGAEKTVAQIIAENYDLTEKEEQLLKLGCLVSKTYTYGVPDASDDLISVDMEKMTVKVKTYKDDKGNVWNPVSADLKVGDEVKETLTFSNGEAKYTYDGDAFSVVVKYELRLTIDKAEQLNLIKAPALLKQGVENLDAIVMADDKLAMLIEAIDVLEKMASADGYPITLGNFTAKIILRTDEAKAAANALAEQKRNNGGVLNINNVSTNYKAAPSSVGYLKDNGADAYAELVATYNYVKAILEDEDSNGVKSLDSLITMAQYDPSQATVISVISGLIKDMTAWCETMEPIIENDWSNNASSLKAGLKQEDYTAIDAILVGMTNTDLSKMSVRENLLVDTTTIQYNMSMFDVKIDVVLMVSNGIVNSDGLREYDRETSVLTFAEGATSQEIVDAIAAKFIEENALAEWNGVYVEDKFTVAKSVLPATLTKDVDYVITYSPALYTVDYAYDTDVQLPYGAKIRLPKADNAAEAYDYTVNGAYYAQNSLYTIVGHAVISRKLGKSYTSYTVNEIVALNYFAKDAKANGILNSGALTVGNDKVNVRVPDVNDGIVRLEGTTLTANNYPSSYNGLEWAPYTYTVVSGTKSTTYTFTGNSASIAEPDFDRVDVAYRLALTNISTGDVKAFVDLPAVLADEAEAQLSVLNRLNGYSDQLNQVDRTLFTILKTVINEDQSMSPAVKKSLEKAINGIINDCIDDNKLLKIANIVAEYDKDGLKYYYTNSAEVIGALDDLCDYFALLLDEEEGIAPGEKKDALKTLITSMGSQYADYAAKVDDLEDLKVKIDGIRSDLKAPNAYIDLTSPNLGKLCTLLTTAGQAKYTGAVDYLYIETAPITVNANGKVTIGASVSLGNNTIHIDSVTFNQGHTLTIDDINGIITKIEAANAELNVSGKYYTSGYSAEALRDLVGKKASELETTYFVYGWTPKEFTVNVEGAPQQTITAENLEIILPTGTSGVRYEYLIDGNTVTSTSYTFTLEQIDRLFDNERVYFIEREEKDISEEGLVDFINALNDAIGNNDIVFALTKNGKDYAVVMKIATYDPKAVMAPMQSLAAALMTQGYSYIAFDDNAFIYTDSDNNMKISLQAMINTIMGNGFGSEMIINLVDKNGKINNIALPGAVISDKNMTVAGGKLAETTLVLGDSAMKIDYNVPLYITLGSAPSQLTSVRNLLDEYVSRFFNFYCEDGKAILDITMPGKAYEAMLAALLVTDNVDFADVNSLNENIAIKFMLDIVHPLLSSDADAQTVTNTFAKFGFDIDFTKHNEAFEAIKDFYKKHYPEAPEYDTEITMNLDISQYLDKLNLGTLGNMIVEKETGVRFGFEANITNFDKNYEALFFDIKASGITNKFGLVENLSAKLGEMSGTAMVILLSDVNSDLTFNTTTILNLNGFAINGKVKGNASVRVIDSIIDDTVYGTINGSISGNVIIAGGKYASDVTAFIPEGYKQNDDGEVVNRFISLSRDEDGNVSIKLDAGILGTNYVPDVKTFAADLIVELLMNGYTGNKLFIDGNKIFQLTVDDVVGMYAATDRVQAVLDRVFNMASASDLLDLFKTLLKDVTDLSDIKEVLDYDLTYGTETPIFTYELITGSWGVTVEHVEAGDYITGSIISRNEKKGTINLVIVGDDADKQQIANLIGMLLDTTKISVGIDKLDISKNGGKVSISTGASAFFTVDLSKDPKYAIMLTVMIADGIGAPKNAELLTALKTYLETNYIDDLTKAFNKLTVADIVTAIRNFNRGETFAAMVARLGLSEYDLGDANVLASDIDVFAKLLGFSVRKLKLKGNGYTMAGFIDEEEYVYRVEKHNVSRNRTIKITSGYSLFAEAEVVDFSATVVLFPEPTDMLLPEFVDGHGAPTISANEKLFGALIDTTGKYIFIDTDAEGITAAELEAVLTFKAINYDSIIIEVSADGDFVNNGATVTATAVNATASVSITYTVIVLGDTCADAEINVKDIVAVVEIILGTNTSIDTNTHMAANILSQDNINIIDLRAIVEKIVSADYMSPLPTLKD